jgi:hypothetical protein
MTLFSGVFAVLLYFRVPLRVLLRTVTVCVQVAELRQASLTVQVTVVVPSSNVVDG